MCNGTYDKSKFGRRDGSNLNYRGFIDVGGEINRVNKGGK